jgi:hypothetical protein
MVSATVGRQVLVYKDDQWRRATIRERSRLFLRKLPRPASPRP